MADIPHIIKVLSTIQVDSAPVVLNCSPEFAELVWFNHVYYRDQRNFELVTERFGSSHCKVSIRNWDKTKDPHWLTLVVFGSLAACILVSLYKMWGNYIG